ncbi:3-isopropylmalate dehydrogenase [Alteribacter lacisalsi]|uniref:3-isopropylmalate dehydrogenase n=1 Tax=Alteribacter lacisalsi TaxID=2045244 RepID=A0A2W0H7N3_9BACI|nr:3-isopropylmalate dehydrogenase [Alteribacter lacisalsi]PYZ97137.1 3-isopropylmalate dehydrogenase [Alteribacter lacisalsi]
MKKITVLPGDGIGPEITREAVLLIEETAEKYGNEFTFQYEDIGGAAVDKHGTPLPQHTVDACRESDAILLGAVGGPKWDKEEASRRPEAGLLGIRKALKLFANLRPINVYPSLLDSSPVRPEIVKNADLLIIRELTGGLYFGTPRERRTGKYGTEAVDTLYYNEAEIERILRKAFELSRFRSKKVTSVDKANVLESSRLWRETADRLAPEYPDVSLEHMLVDNAAMQLIRDPAQFDVMVTENMFGDILSDEASMITGSLGMLPSASIGSEGPGLYEPVHGSAPDIAGENKANPLAAFSSAAMLLKYSFNMAGEAAAIEKAIKTTLDQGYRTQDIAGKGEKVLSTKEMGKAVRSFLPEHATVKL